MLGHSLSRAAYRHGWKVELKPNTRTFEMDYHATMIAMEYMKTPIDQPRTMEELVTEERERKLKKTIRSAIIDETKADKVLQKLNYDSRVALLNEPLNIIRCNHGYVFSSAIDWSGIFLVVHDRLDPRVNRTSFHQLAVDCTPEDWPEDLRIGLNMLSNFAHYVSYEDRKEAYYDMDNNPRGELCNRFWSVSRQLILTKNLLNVG